MKSGSRMYSTAAHYYNLNFRDMPGQAQNLVNKLKADSTIDFQNDWKMITLFVGGNNLCAFCRNVVGTLR